MAIKVFELGFGSLFFAITIFTICRILAARGIKLLLYFIIIEFLLFLLLVGGSGALSDAYERFEKFKDLENNNRLLEAKANPELFDNMFQIDLVEFKNSNEFIEYINGREYMLEIIALLLLGFFISIIFELAWYIYRRCRVK